MSTARPITADNAPNIGVFNPEILASQAYYPKLRDVILGERFVCTRPLFNGKQTAVIVAVEIENRSVELRVNLSQAYKPISSALGIVACRIASAIEDNCS